MQIAVYQAFTVLHVNVTQLEHLGAEGPAFPGRVTHGQPFGIRIRIIMRVMVVDGVLIF